MSDNLPLPSARFLTREQAASYVGVGVTTFDGEVRAGIWPPAMRRGTKTSALTWDRKLLDRAADRLGGLIEANAPGADLAAAEQAALEASRGTPAKNRHQHRHTKAA
jgi:hypothetical protein